MIYYNSIIVSKWRYKMSEANMNDVSMSESNSLLAKGANYLGYASAATNVLQGLGTLFSAGDVFKYQYTWF